MASRGEELVEEKS